MKAVLAVAGLTPRTWATSSQNAASATVGGRGASCLPEPWGTLPSLKETPPWVAPRECVNARRDYFYTFIMTFYVYIFYIFVLHLPYQYTAGMVEVNAMKLKELRQRRVLTLQELEERSSVSYNTI